jgi:hypothetical protein
VKLFTAMALVETTLEHRVFLERRLQIAERPTLANCQFSVCRRRPGWVAMVEKTPAFRQRRAADTARWGERLHRGAAVYPVEVDGTTFDLMERFAGLKASKVDDRGAVAVALGKLLRLALAALLREVENHRRDASPRRG